MQFKTFHPRSHYTTKRGRAYFARSIYIVTVLALHKPSTFALPSPIKPSSSKHHQRDLPTVHTSPTFGGPTTNSMSVAESESSENTTKRLQKHAELSDISSTVWEAYLNVPTEPAVLENQDHNLTLLTPTPPWKEKHATAAFDGTVTPFSPNERTSSSSSLTPSRTVNMSSSRASLPLLFPTPLPGRFTPDLPCGSSRTSHFVNEGIIIGRFERYHCLQEWTVHVPEGNGIVVEVHHVWMTEHDTLEIHTIGGNNTLKRRFRNFSAESLAPLLMKDSGMQIIFATPKDGIIPHRNSNFNLTYTSHPNSDVPKFHRIVGGQTESAYIYLCAGITNLPKVIMCDGIQHCQNGEDETSCAYRDKGCGDWFPYGNHCFKATFFATTFKAKIPGQVDPNMPLQAAAACQSKDDATLASLQEPGAKDMAVRMVRNSGYRSAVVGLKKVKPINRNLKHLYRFIWQWGEQGSPIAYNQQELQIDGIKYDCAYLTLRPGVVYHSFPCVLPNIVPDGYICMKENPALSPKKLTFSQITFRKASTLPDKFPTKQCADESVVQVFHRCQWGEGDGKDTSGWSLNNLPLFQCRFGPAVHYSLLCDGKDDCADRSDEMGCQKPQFFPLLTSSFICKNMQAISQDKRCNANVDCFDDSDEEACDTCGSQLMCPGVGCVPTRYAEYFDMCPVVASYSTEFEYTLGLHGSVLMNGVGMFRLGPAPVDECSEGFYPCDGGHCIPTFLLNNGEQDCPQGEDEGIPAHNMTCPGYYRCLNVGTCIHSRYVCDGIYHCPYKDDEMFCHMTCPQDDGCVCEGQAYTCSKMIDPLQNLHVRYLDLSHASVVSMENIHFMEYLFYLNISYCRLNNITLASMLHLQTLDVSSNFLQGLDSLNFQKLPGLRYLDVSNNPLVQVPGNAFSAMLDIGEFYQLEVLIMGNASLETIGEKAFNFLSKLKRLDIRANPIHRVDKDSLFGLLELKELYTDQSKLCCSYFHPTLSKCYSPVDELSSCDDLLAQDFFRVFLWTFSVLAMSGNAGVLIYRTCINARNSAAAALVRNLCVADLLMGVYLLMIGVADAVFRGVYVSEENQWRSSTLCTAAGFISFVSSEVSALSICVITLDRILVICFPFKSAIHLSPQFASSACLALWVTVISLAAVPLLTDMEFYGHTGICIPLPITHQTFTGQTYAFSIFIVLNFILFIFIGVGQLLIFYAVRKAGLAAGTARRERDTTIARRLFLVVFTDFCCWFPIGLMGLLAAGGMPIPGKVNVWVAVFVLPLNSALNPFLYTLNGLREQWKKQRLEKRSRRIFSMMKTEIPKLQPTSMEEMIRICIRSESVKKEAVLKMLGISADGKEDVVSNSTASISTENSIHSAQGHTTLKAPVLCRTPTLSNAGPG